MAFDLVEVTDALKVFERHFVISPKQLKKFSTVASLVWKKVEFTPANKATIPKSRGIYAFVVEHNDLGLPPHGYVMYVGISGDTSKRTLQIRYGDYLQDKIRNKRASIHFMLNKWDECLFFHYAEVKDKRIKLSKLEQDMSDALFPPFSKKDFSAEIRQVKKAF